jgi:hypothetical protein
VVLRGEDTTAALTFPQMTLYNAGPYMNPEFLLAVAIPLGFWLFDTILKVLGRIDYSDVGADLCLFCISFNTTTIFVHALKSGNTVELEAQRLTAICVGVLVYSLIIYVFSLIVIAPKRRKYPRFFEWFRNKSWSVTFTVALGFLSLFLEIAIYLSLYKR